MIQAGEREREAPVGSDSKYLLHEYVIKGQKISVITIRGDASFRKEKDLCLHRVKLKLKWTDVGVNSF